MLYRSQFLLRLAGALLIAGYLYTPFATAAQLAARHWTNGVVLAYSAAVVAVMLAARGATLGAWLQRVVVGLDLALLGLILPADPRVRLPAAFFLYLVFLDYGLRYGIRRYLEALAAALVVLPLQAAWHAGFRLGDLAPEDSWTLILFALAGGTGALLLYERESVSMRPRGLGFSERMAAEAAGIGSFEVQLLSREVHCDDQLRRLFGLAPGNPLGSYEDTMQRFHPEDRDYVRREIQAGLAARSAIDLAARVIWPDGTEHMLAARCQVLDDQLGVPHLIGMAWDITDTMRAREQARRLERWRRAATHTGGVVVWSYDVQEHKWEMDGDGDALFHLTPGTVNDDGDDVAAFIPRSDLPQLEQAMRKALETGEYDVEFRVVGHDGRERWMHSQGVAERNRRGQIARLVGSTWNADADVRLRMQAQARQAELERAYRELESFTQIAAHDFKEPLRGIRNYAQYLQEDYADRLDDSGRDMLQRLATLGQRLELLINNLLEVSRVSWMPLQRLETDLNVLVDDVLSTLDFTLREHNVHIRRPRTLPSVDCDPVHVGELYRNLITNAVKYNDAPERWIEVGWHGRPDEPVLYVRDNGIGIPPQHHEDIFQLFRRLHTRESYGGGSGMGLTIVRKIVERHDGRIWLESEPGQGTTFYFRLAPEGAPAAS